MLPSAVGFFTKAANRDVVRKGWGAWGSVNSERGSERCYRLGWVRSPFHTWGRKKELGDGTGPGHTRFRVCKWVIVAALGDEFGRRAPPLSHTHTYTHSAEI